MNKLLFVMFLLLSTPVLAEQRHMKLLAISELDGKMNGSIADLFLEVVPGKNRVFLETFPLTRFDTQISTRFAKDVACLLIENDCSLHDFIYTIKAESTIIGGPSAGAALSLLTAAALLDVPLREDVAITGTINSGGLIGPVSGIPEKMDAAAQIGIKKVLIPKGTRQYKQLLPTPIITNGTIGNKTVNVTLTKISNQTIDLVEHGARLNISVIEVADLNTAFYEFTDIYLYHNGKNVTKESAYNSVMQDVAAQLCGRTRTLDALVPPHTNSSYVQQATNLRDRAENASLRGDFYSQASFCFGANTKLQTENIRQQNLSAREVHDTLARIRRDVENLTGEVNNVRLATLTDVQAYMIAHERLAETSQAADFTRKLLEANETTVPDQLAYTVERLQSAKSWMQFLGVPGKEFIIDQTAMREACLRKLAEAQERYQYVRTLYSSLLGTTEETLQHAQERFQDGKYLLCLHTASKAKAEADVVLNTIGVSDDLLGDYVGNKLELVREVIARVQERGIFPLLGYSYWEYASSLQQYDLYSALLFSEYAQEMTQVNLYFAEKKESSIDLKQYLPTVLVFTVGFVWGVLAAMVFLRVRRKK